MKKYFPIFILFLASCAYDLSPYTARLQENTNLNTEQLKNIQFYISNDIILYRDVSNSETEISEGELKVMNGQNVEQVIIQSGTPGIVVGSDDKKSLLVSFDKDGSYLRFGLNTNQDGRYTLMAKEWDGRTGIVDYEGKEFKTTPESIYSYLLLNIKQINNITVDTKEASGRTLSP